MLLASKFLSRSIFSRGLPPIIGSFRFVLFHLVEFVTSAGVFGTLGHSVQRGKTAGRLDPEEFLCKSTECSSKVRPLDSVAAPPPFLLPVPFNLLSKSFLIFRARKFSQFLNGKYFISCWWKFSGSPKEIFKHSWKQFLAWASQNPPPRPKAEPPPPPASPLPP